jgi:HlyD family secretion protein
MKRSTKIVLIVGAVAAVGLGSALVISQRGRKGLEVNVGKVVHKELVSTVLANGKIQPRRKVDISANRAGQVVNLAVREGDAVDKRDFLLQIDQVQYRASARSSEANLQSLLHDRDAAQANLEQAEYDFDKARKSYDDELIPEADLQRARSSHEAAQAGLSAAQTRVEQARASLEGVRDSLNKTTIRSPLAGVVTSLPIHEGEVAVIGTMNNPGTVLMTISDLSEMDADLAVDETDVPRLAIGQAAVITIEAYQERKFDGMVREIGSSPIQPGSDVAARTGTTTTEAIDFEVKVTVLDPPEGIRPGFSVTAEIETGRVIDVPVIPIQALVSRQAPATEGEQPEVQEGVYVMEEGKARFVPLQTGLTGALEIEVKEGLEEDAEIIIGPFRALRELEDGTAVRVAESEADRE